MQFLHMWHARRFPVAALAIALLSMVLVANVGAAPTPGPGDTVPGRYIVLLKPGADAVQVARAHGLSLELRYDSAVHGFAARGAPGLLKKLQADPAVALVEPDRQVSISAQTLPTGVNRIDAELSPTAKVNGLDERVNVDVAIIDTGVQTNHPDVKVAGGKNCTFYNGYGDGNGHGTHVAGTVAALDNGSGVVGVAPGARIWSVRVLGSNGSGYLSWIVCGIDWVTSRAGTIEVANMSLGYQGTSPSVDAAITRSVAAGIVYAVAAGNSAADAAGFGPANHPDVLAVSAIADFDGKAGGTGSPTCRSDVDDTFADFSNYGEVVDIAAPGVCILSTYKGSRYATLSGTSMASPHVAGAAALYIAKNGRDRNADGLVNKLDVDLVRSALLAAAKPQSDAAYGLVASDPDIWAEPVLHVGGF